VRAKLLLDAGAERARLDVGSTGHGVDLQDPVHPRQIQRDGRPVRRRDPTDHRRTAPEGHDGDTLLAGPVQQAGHVVGRARHRHPVGRRSDPATHGMRNVTEGLAMGVSHPLPVRVDRGIDQVAQGCWQVHPRGREIDGGDVWRTDWIRWRTPELGPDQRCQPLKLLVGDRRCLVAPPPPRPRHELTSGARPMSPATAR
jgi:hypothetical protein